MNQISEVGKENCVYVNLVLCVWYLHVFHIFLIHKLINLSQSVDIFMFV